MTLTLSADARRQVQAQIPASPLPAWCSLLVLVVLLGLIAIGLGHASVPAPVAASAPPTAFSSARAMLQLRQIASTSHPTGSAANAAVRAYLVKELTALGLAPEVHQGTGIRTRGGAPAGGPMHNVVVRLPGTTPGKALLLAAHYDSAPLSLGAADNGASVAAILETLRALKAGAPLRNDVIAIFTDGEEAGLLGSETFVASDPWAKLAGMVLNFEYRGNGGPMLMFEASNGNGRLIAGLKTVPHPLGNSLMHEVYQRMPNDTDMTQLRRIGVPGMNFGAIEGLTHYHTALDRPELFSEASLQHQGDTMLALARHFGAVSLDSIKADDSVYFDAAGIGMVSYPQAAALPLGALAAVLFGAALWLGKRRAAVRPARVIGAAFGMLVASFALAALAQLLWFAIGKVHPDYALLLQGDTYNSHWYLIAFCAFTAGLFTLGLTRAGTYLTATEQGLGAAGLWLALLIGASVAMPGASFLLLWPLVGALLASLVLLLPWAARQPNTVRAAILLLGAVPAVILVAPFVRQVYISLTPQSVGVPMLLLALLLCLLTPLLGMVSRRRTVPLALLAICAACLLTAGAGAGFSDEHPRPNTLSYAQHGDAGKALWLSSDNDLDAWTSTFFPTQQVGKVPEIFGDARISVWHEAAPSLNLPAPTAEVVSDVLADGKRNLTLRVKSPRRAETIAVRVEAAEVFGASFDGRELDGINPKRWRFDIHGVAEQGHLLRLTVPAATAFQVRLTDLSYGLALAPHQARPSGMIAQPMRDSDTTRVVAVIPFK